MLKISLINKNILLTNIKKLEGDIMEQIFGNILEMIQPTRVLPVLVGVMAIDVFFGAFQAAKEGRFKPSLLAEGLFHKLNMLVPLILAVLADALIVSNYQYFTIFTGLFFIAYEGSSILQTYVASGYKAPSFLKKIFDTIGESVEKKEEVEA